MKAKKYLYIVIIVFVLSLIPLYIIGFYNHPSVDDYYYGVNTSQKWQETGSVAEVLKTSFNEMKTTYNEWQGNFSAIFLMRLQPAVFDENTYFLSSVILITSFVIAMLTFLYTFLRKWFDAGKMASAGAAVCITFCAMQFTFVPSDSFYWFNGSIYYTFFFSLMLVLFTLVTLVIKSRKTAAQIISGIFAFLLAFIIGGGNYATALFTVLTLISLSVILFIRKKRTAVPVILITLMSIVSLLISVKAPGNAIRQAAVGGNSGVIKAVLTSFVYALYNFASATSAPVVILWIALLPVFYKIAVNSRMDFKHPVLVLLFTFGLYAAQGTPVFYAQGLRMPYRMMNIIYFNYYIFVTFNLIYICGFIGKKYGDRPVIITISGFLNKAKNRFVCLMASLVLFSVFSVGLIKVTEREDGGASFSKMPLSISAAYSLITGEAKQYDKECTMRDNYLKTTPETDIVLSPLSVHPEVIFHTDITDDPLHWKNAHMAIYYKKASIKLDS